MTTTENDIVGSNLTSNVTIGNNAATITIGSNDSSVTIGSGNDTITAGDHDTITVGNGANNITIGNFDTLTVGSGQNTIVAGHDDNITVGNGKNTITAGANSNITAGNGQDNITAGPASTIVVGNGKNTITAGANSNITAGNGQDNITAGPANTIVVGNGNDIVHVGHDSTVTDGSGPKEVHAGTSDTLNFDVKSSKPTIDYDGLTPKFTVPSSTVNVSEEQSIPIPITLLPPNFGNEVVNGFKTQNGVIFFDTNDFANYAAVQANMAQVGPNVVITQPGGSGTVTLTNTSIGSLSSSNFGFFTGAVDQITISGLPTDATLSAGTNNGGGVWSLTPSQLSGLTLNAGEPTPVDTITVTMTNPAGEGATSSQTFPLLVHAIPPTVGVSVIPYTLGDNIYETRLQLSSAVDDADSGNDNISNIVLTGVPIGTTISSPNANVTNNGGGVYTLTRMGGPASTFNPEVDVTTPTATSTNFNLGITANASEPNGLAADETSSTSQNINVEYKPESFTPTFTSTGQNIWTSGSAFTLDDNRFLGVDFPNGFPGSGPATASGSLLGISVGASAGVRAGFESNLHLDAGEFNGSLPYNVNMPTVFNHTNDTLEVDPSDSKGVGSFNTTSPQGSYSLDFVFDIFLSAHAGPVQVTLSGSTDINLLTLNSSQLSHTFNLPDGLGNVKVAWPTVNTSGSGSGSTITASGTSNPIFSVDIDPIAVIADILLGSDPLKGSHSVNVLLGSLSYKYTILAGTVAPGLELAQSFTLTDNGPTPTLTDNGTPEPFSFGSPTVIQNAPSTNNFSLELDPNTTLSNRTGLAGQLQLGLTVLKASGTVTAFGFSTSASIGPAFHPTTTLHFGSITLYQNTFPVAFNSQTVNYSVT